MLSQISLDWINLTDVNLSKKDIIGITQLGDCTKLVSLNLSGNNITKLPIDMFKKSSMFSYTAHSFTHFFMKTQQRTKIKQGEITLTKYSKK